ncbi:hypothetical protein [Nocardia sp. NPDC059239]|uniref:hypothetical protein n=1 Tax=unclassified Nocardia TaxID=2637762 RepID=UPI0036C4F20F
MDLVLALIIAVTAVLGATHMASRPRHLGAHHEHPRISLAEIQARLDAEQAAGEYRS